MDNEVWKDIKDYEGLYQVSNFGRIKSLERYKNCHSKKVLVKEKLLSGHTRRPNTNDYLNVVLSKNGECKRYAIHRLVAQEFIDNPDGKPQVNHIDGNKQNNRADNLEWCTNKENCIHAVKNGLFRKKKNKKIIQLSLRGEKLKVWDTLAEIQDELGIDKRLVHRCCNHYENTKKAKGFIWKFEEEYEHEQSNNIG